MQIAGEKKINELYMDWGTPLVNFNSKDTLLPVTTVYKRTFPLFHCCTLHSLISFHNKMYTKQIVKLHQSQQCFIILLQVITLVRHVLTQGPKKEASSVEIRLQNKYCLLNYVKQFLLYCIVARSWWLMPPDALQPNAYCTNPGLQSFLLAPPGVSTRDLSSERRNYLGEEQSMNFA